jgi:hypothetical protein
MTFGKDDRHREIPTNWDVLADAGDEPSPGHASAPIAEPPGGLSLPPTINLVASFWADGVVVLAVLTAALLGLNAAGHREVVAALPFAAILGLAWWLFAAAVLVTIRQGTPGMLLAGIQFADHVAPARVAAVLAVAAIGALLFGLPGLLGAGRSPLALAGGRALEALRAD